MGVFVLAVVAFCLLLRSMTDCPALSEERRRQIKRSGW